MWNARWAEDKGVQGGGSLKGSECFSGYQLFQSLEFVMVAVVPSNLVILIVNGSL
jgi:hypothetical protein